MTLFQRVAEFEQAFRTQGWALWQMPEVSVVEEISRQLLVKLRDLLKDPTATLEEYHLRQPADDQHYKVQYEMTKFFRDAKFAKKVISSQLDFFRLLLGPDLLVQRNPYLRVTRPNAPQDNIGFHRDTFYGGSPFEFSCVIPFVDVAAEASLGFVNGSHTHSEDAYPTEQVAGAPENHKGSVKHQMGFLYAPKLIKKNLSAEVQKVAVKKGQLLIFSLATVHGSEVNTSPSCRWSTDTRVLNRYYPVDLSARPDYYEELSQSIATESTLRYLANQPDLGKKEQPVTL